MGADEPEGDAAPISGVVCWVLEGEASISPFIPLCAAPTPELGVATCEEPELCWPSDTVRCLSHRHDGDGAASVAGDASISFLPHFSHVLSLSLLCLSSPFSLCTLALYAFADARGRARARTRFAVAFVEDAVKSSGLATAANRQGRGDKGKPKSGKEKPGVSSAFPPSSWSMMNSWDDRELKKEGIKHTLLLLQLYLYHHILITTLVIVLLAVHYAIKCFFVVFLERAKQAFE